ncbi:unnamed protein product [Rhizopus stolonifer]
MLAKCFSVRAIFTFELCLAQFWSALGKHVVDISLNFHGVQITGSFANGKSTLFLEHQLTRLDVSAPLRREDALNVKVFFSDLLKHKNLTTIPCAAPNKAKKPVQDEYDESFTVKVPWIAQVPPLMLIIIALYSVNILILKRETLTITFTNSKRSMKEISKGSYIKFVQLEDEYSKVCVIYIQYFFIASEDKDNFINDVISGLQDFEKKKKNGIEKNILDLSSNGDGDVYAGEFMIGILFNSTPDYLSDIKYLPFFERVVKKEKDQESTKWTGYASEKYLRPAESNITPRHPDRDTLPIFS